MERKSKAASYGRDSNTIMADANEAEQQGMATSIAGFEIVKLVREFVEVKANVFGNTYGELLDAHLREAAERGEEIQTVSLHIEPKGWELYANALTGRITD